MTKASSCEFITYVQKVHNGGFVVIKITYNNKVSLFI